MSDIWLKPEAVFSGSELTYGAVLRIEGAKVRQIVNPENAIDICEIEPIAGVVAPGFVDLQVNGGGGCLFNSEPSVTGIETILAAHHPTGTAALMPTVITDTPDVMRRAAEAVRDAKNLAGVAGIHIEGPHIDEARRGTHARKHIRPFDDETMRVCTMLRAADIPVMLTVSPNAIQSHEIKTLSEMGVVVSLGHTQATAEITLAAINAGAACATHLMNAMPPMESRNPGIVGAIMDTGTPAGMIFDGFHVDDSVMRLLLRAAHPGQLFAVSDSMPTINGPTQFELPETTVTLQNGRLVNDEGALAGAHITMAQSVERLVSCLNINLETALRMAISTPAKLIGRAGFGDIVEKSLNQLVVVDWRGKTVLAGDECLRIRT